MKKSLLLTSAALLAMSTAASAATLSMSGGSSGMIPQFGESNEILQEVFGFNSGQALMGGKFGAQISVDVATEVQVDYWGYEAAAANSFTMNGSAGETPVSFSTATTPASFIQGTYLAFAGPFTSIASDTINVDSGLLDFSFSTSIGGQTVTNADGAINSPATQANFYSWMTSTATTTTVFMFFDDTGAGDDDNHDDLVVSLTVNGLPGAPNPTAVPLPAGGLLLLGGLGAFAATRRRKNKA